MAASGVTEGGGWTGGIAGGGACDGVGWVGFGGTFAILIFCGGAAAGAFGNGRAETVGGGGAVGVGAGFKLLNIKYASEILSACGVAFGSDASVGLVVAFEGGAVAVAD